MYAAAAAVVLGAARVGILEGVSERAAVLTAHTKDNFAELAFLAHHVRVAKSLNVDLLPTAQVVPTVDPVSLAAATGGPVSAQAIYNNTTAAVTTTTTTDALSYTHSHTNTHSTHGVELSGVEGSVVVSESDRLYVHADGLVHVLAGDVGGAGPSCGALAATPLGVNVYGGKTPVTMSTTATNIETSKTTRVIDTVIQKANSYAKALKRAWSDFTDDEGWVSIGKTDTLRMYKRKVEGTEHWRYKTQGFVKGITADRLFAVYQDMEYRKTWDGHVKEMKCLEGSERGGELIFWEMQMPRPFWNRAFLFMRRAWEGVTSNGEKLYVVVAEHQPLEDAEAIIKKEASGTVVQVETYTSSLVLQDVDGGCEVMLASRQNLQANIPSWLSKKTVTYVVPEFHKKLVSACEKYDEWKREQKVSESV